MAAENAGAPAPVPQGLSFKLLSREPGRALAVRTRPRPFSWLLAASGVGLALFVLRSAHYGWGFGDLAFHPVEFLSRTPVLTLLGFAFFFGLAAFWCVFTCWGCGVDWQELRIADGRVTCQGLLGADRIALADVREARFQVLGSSKYGRPRGNWSATLWLETANGKVRALSWSVPASYQGDLDRQIGFLRQELAALLPPGAKQG